MRLKLLCDHPNLRRSGEMKKGRNAIESIRIEWRKSMAKEQDITVDNVRGINRRLGFELCGRRQRCGITAP